MRRIRIFTWFLAFLLVTQTLAAVGASAASGTPQVVALLPADNASVVTLNSNLLVEFDRDVSLGGSGSILLKQLKTFETAATYDVNDGAHVQLIRSRYLLIKPDAGAYKLGDDIYVQITPDAIVGYPGITDTTSWNFRIGSSNDLAKPVATALTPVKNGTLGTLGGALTIKFSEPVIPGAGAINIVDLSNANTICSLPAKGGSFSGWGTQTITIQPCTSFKENMIYAVQIAGDAISDMSGNYYAGIPATDTTTWRFSTTTDSVPPELVTIDPDNGANYVRVNATLRMTFSEPVVYNSGMSGLAIPQGGGASIPLVFGPGDGASPDPRVITLTPASPFVQAKTYVVQIPAQAIADVAGNYFPGILNNYRWTFQTYGSDRTAPTLSSAAIDGSSILLTYSEKLDESAVPYASNYYVTVNDVPRQVNNVTVSGKEVRLELQTGVTVGQTVKLSYTVGDIPLTDLSGNAAAAFSAKAVSNTTNTTLPKVSSGLAAGRTLTLTFNKALQSVSSSAASQFTVKVNGASVGVGSASVSGSKLTLTLGTTIADSRTVSVSYVPGSYPLTDTSGNQVASFSDYYVQTDSDTTAPVLSSSSASGNKITLNYNEGLDESLVPLKSSYSVLVNGVAYSVSSIDVTNNRVTLTLTASITTGKSVLVTYAPSGTYLSDLAGNRASGFSNQQIIAGSSSAAALSSAVVSGTKLTLTYSVSLNAGSVPLKLQYIAKADGVYVDVQKVEVAGTQVTLTLATAIRAGQDVRLTYYDSGTPLTDVNGQNVAAFDSLAVANQTSGTGTLPGGAAIDEDGGLTLDASAATKSSGVTPSGKSANRYTISGDALVQAYASIKSNSTTIRNPQVTFVVPSTEAGAIVSLPISALMNASGFISNAAVKIKYGANAFTLPLSAVNFAQQLQVIGASDANASLVLGIEKTTDASLNQAISGQGAKMLSSAVNFTSAISTGGAEREIKSYDAYVTRTFSLNTSAGKPSEIAVVRYDAEAGVLSYVPTTTTVSGATMNVNFLRKSNSVYAVVSKSRTIYSDMTKHWAKDDVAALAAKFVVSGPTKTTFAPEKNITRAEFAEFLARGLGLNGDKAAAVRFKDVSAGDASAAFIGAVSTAGIVQGDTAGKFNPKASITREEMATMMLRAMSYAGTQPSTSSSSMSKFLDRGSVSSWASAAVAANIEAGIMNGVTTTQFKPKDNATRAQAATMVRRFLTYVEMIET